MMRSPLRCCLPLVSAGLVTMTGCWGPSRPPPVDIDQGHVIVLEDTPFAELSIPNESRPGGAEPPVKIAVRGAWRYEGTTRKGMHKFSLPNPIRPRGLFFHQAPGGATLSLGDESLRYDRFGDSDRPMWSIDRDRLYVYQPKRTPPGDGLLLQSELALEREQSLNYVYAGIERRETFVWTSIQNDWDQRRGLLLAAPGTAAWRLTVPPAGELSFVSGIALPEIRETASGSDGATLVVEIEAEGATTEAGRFSLQSGEFVPRRIDLSAHAGQSILLRLRTEPGPTATFDYAFIAEPVVASRVDDPVRVVMVFIDTLRPDHMSLYGYRRDTTKAIDGLADDSVIFTAARSIAPWTLPSAMTMVTGRHPELYFAEDTRTVQSLLGDKGFANAFFAGNVYLSSNFHMARDWDLHRVGLWPMAKEVTDDALQWLDEHEGRDAIVQVHYMDPHLPYLEPLTYRPLYAGAGPAGLRTDFHLGDVRRARIENDPAAQQYIQDRYDNNIRYATDQIARIIDRLDDNDILLLYADHGEEFWEHGGFEHGHTLFDEVLRVPLVIRAPGVRVRSIDTPVSLLDLTPTILDLVGEPIPASVQGRSLVPLLTDAPGATESFTARDQAFGRPLYGLERWGVLHGDMKWMTTEGREALYDLATDPGETNNLMRVAKDDRGKPYRGYFADAVGRETRPAYRITPSRARPAPGDPILPTWALCTIEGGFAEAWDGADPLKYGSATVRAVESREAIEGLLTDFQILTHQMPDNPGRAYQMCWEAGRTGTREIYLLPQGELETVGHTLQCSIYAGNAEGGRRATLSVPGHRAILGGSRTPLSRARLPQRNVLLQYGIGPRPARGVINVEGSNSEMSGGLEAMGYVQANERGPVGDCVPPAVQLEVPERLQAKQESPK